MSDNEPTPIGYYRTRSGRSMGLQRHSALLNAQIAAHGAIEHTRRMFTAMRAAGLQPDADAEAELYAYLNTARLVIEDELS